MSSHIASSVIKPEKQTILLRFLHDDGLRNEAAAEVRCAALHACARPLFTYCTPTTRGFPAMDPDVFPPRCALLVLGAPPPFTIHTWLDDAVVGAPTTTTMPGIQARGPKDDKKRPGSPSETVPAAKKTAKSGKSGNSAAKSGW